MPGLTVNDVNGRAGRKRSRREASQDGHDDEVVDVRQASSSLQSEGRHKRVRISEGRQKEQSRSRRQASESSSEEDEDVTMHEQGERDEDMPATQYEIMRDAGFRHLRHADEDDRIATQRIQQRERDRKSNRAEAANAAAENGILQSIECVNFMCHLRLHVELGPLLNFIVGENGSGKSAVLTAITLCLGGKASSTNRGGSLKNFIKEGKDKSILIVKIKNEGVDAYQPDIYGESIIVERHFTRSGSSGFHIKSATGRVISTKKGDVDEIVEYYCLQVDNPLNVLSQDNARQFLNQASAKQKYKFFCQGVQLQQLDDDYRVIEEYLNSNIHKQGDLEVRMDAAEKDYNKAKQDYRLFMESEDLRQQRVMVGNKAAWSQVVDQERKRDEYKRRAIEAAAQVTRLTDQARKTDENVQAYDQKITDATGGLDALKEEHEGHVAVYEEARTAHKEARDSLENIRNQERVAHSQVESADKSIKDFEQKIREEEERLQDLNGDAITRKNKELEDAKATLQDIQKESEQEQRRVPGLNTEIDAAKKELGTIDGLTTRKKNDIAAVKTRIREIEMGQGTLYDAYEGQMRNLLRMIDEDAGFQRKPVGPIGAHVRVLKPLWAPMLERFFGDHLNGFVVSNKRDHGRLSEMMKRLRITRSPIIIGNAAPIDTSRFEPDKGFDTILRILEIDDPLIRNQLIINQSVEKAILIEDKDDAERTMMAAAPPKNVGVCFHRHPRKRNEFVRFTAKNGGSYSSSPIKPPPPHQRPRLKSDSKQEASAQQENLRVFQEELKDLQQQKQQQQQTVARCTKAIKDIQKLVETNKQKVRRVQADMENIESELDAFEGVDGRLEGLRAELHMAKESFEVYGDQFGTAQLRRNEQNEVCEKLNADLKSKKNACTRAQAEMEKAARKIEALNDARSLAVSATNEAHEKVAMADNEVKELETKREKTSLIIEQWTKQAERLCERVHIGENETYPMIEKRLDSLNKILAEREKKRGMTDAEVMRRAQETQDTYTSLKQAYDQVDQEIEALKTTLAQRLDKWRKFQRYISSNSRANFMYLLSERDFRGRLTLDHESHTLDVHVEPDKTRKNAAARNTKTLSGGEKSFSSICLLLAIWEAMGSPLRCLDEFDVFMDNVNRAISTNMLVSAARNSVGRQYILITPNAIEGRAKLDKDVKIIRLTDPRQRLLADH